jgi:methyl-accepting chemotaxis protein/methyl-accepting chemotaxis protein-1 (serine sensor receptor)
MEQVTQKTAAQAEESAAAAEELNAESESLKDIVERLTAMVGGSRNDGRAAPRRKQAATTRHTASSQPSRQRESESGLSVPVAAAPYKSANGQTAKPALAALQPDKDAFPLEEEFKEF